MARILITGASGLIGRRVTEAFDVRGSDDLVRLRRSDADLLAPAAWDRVFDDVRPDVVVHLAWSASALPDYRGHDDNWRWAESTIDGATLAVRRGIRFLGTGTSVDDVPSVDAYSRAKAATRDALQKSIADRDIAWMRPFYVFDEARPSPAVLRDALAAKAAGEHVHLASATARHDFVHARDVGTAAQIAVTAGLLGAIDIGSGSLTTVSDLVAAFGVDWVSEGAPSSAATSDAVADVTALREAGWAPQATIARLGRSS